MLDVNVFDSMRIGLASADKIREWSHGEVKKPETINYRTLKPERDGLFCERIFGPTRDWECHCGKYKRIRYKGMVCDRCGVEVTRAKVRRERMGHIELAAPVSHIWYFKGIPSRMGLILDLSPRALEKVLYFASYIVIDPAGSGLQKKQLLMESEYRQAREKYGSAFKVGMGAEAIEELLAELDLEEMAKELREELKTAPGQKKVRAIRRLEVVEAFRKSGNRPEWMILNVVPVIPPDLRPMVQLDGGRFATSDLNDLYRRVINRNNRLKRLLDLGAPDIIVRNEKRMLQEAVDALIDNGRRGRPVTGPGNRPLKSLSDMLKGKQGRFRQNLLGKRVDYSGRSVIVVGPELKLHQCGLPKEMALELFKPFVMKKLVSDGLVVNIKAAKRKVERATPEVWDVLEEVIKEHPVLLNRAPTLHRLGIQAFEPVLTEGRALKLHPLACTAYNADFDGDQMAIHLPLSAEAQAEARILMLCANHILAPKDGKPIIVPTQDMVLGSYYLTIIRPNAAGSGRVVTGIAEAIQAYQAGQLELQAEITARLPISQTPRWLRNEVLKADPQAQTVMVKTSLGRMIFNEILPVELRYFNYELGIRNEESGGRVKYSLGITMNKKELGKLVGNCYRLGATKTAEVIDKVKNLGYHYACKAGMTVAISDVEVPEAKATIIEATKGKVNRVEKQYGRGLITDEERYRKVVDLWTEATNLVADAMMDNLADKAKAGDFNPIFMMADSGARGNKQQMRQLAGMRGLMADPSGKIIDLPITANFREGLSVSDYFISSHGARKGLADTALRTADSGYLTRRLVDVAQDVIVREEDCDISCVNMMILRAKLCENTFDALEILNDMLVGRVLAEDIVIDNPPPNEAAADDLTTYTTTPQFLIPNSPFLIAKDTVLDEETLTLIGEHNIETISIKATNFGHVMVSEEVRLGTHDPERRREERENIIHELLGKELTHDIINEELGIRNYESKDKNAEVTTQQTEGTDDNSATPPHPQFNIPNSTFLINTLAFKGDILNEEIINDILDSDVKEIFVRNNTIRGIEVEAIKEGSGIIESLAERIVGRVLAEDIYDESGELIAEINETVDDELAHKIEAVRDRVQIRSVLTCKSTSGVCKKCYGRDLANEREVEVGEAVGIIAAQSIGEPGTQLTMRTFHTGGVAGEDITQGLPRVEELFEARKPKHNAIIGEIDGIVRIGVDEKGLKRVRIEPSEEPSEKNTTASELEKNTIASELRIPHSELNKRINTIEREYVIPYGSRVIVEEGQWIKAGSKLTEGAINPHDILRVCGLRETQRYLVYEVQKVYKSQGVEINDKHIEVMVRQMLHKVKIEESGTTDFLPGEYVDLMAFEAANTKAIEEDGEPAVAKPILLGITKASLATDSFLSAASFQETTRVLTDAAIKGKVDPLIGLKENVIIGKLIPAGTGMPIYRDLEVVEESEQNPAASPEDTEGQSPLPTNENNDSPATDEVINNA